MTEQFKIGFIGLGIMGAPMAKNLINAKYEVYVYDIRQESIKNLVENGAIATKNSLDLGEKAKAGPALADFNGNGINRKRKNGI